MIGELDRCPRCGERPERVETVDDRADEWWRVRCGCRRPRWLLVASSSDRPRTSSPATDERDAVERAREMWSAALPLPGTAAETYLRDARGISPPHPQVLRFAARCWYAPGQYLPAMIAAVQDVRGRIVAVHRTYLAADGSRRLDRRMLGPVRGGAVRLAAATKTLAVAEGIESALSVLQATGLPTWAALSAPGLAALELPVGVCEVVVVADGDPTGIAAAERAAERWSNEGRGVRIARPPDGADANDLLRKGAAAA